MDNSSTVERDPVVAALARCPLFAALGEDDLVGLAREMRTRRFRRGEVLFHQGDPGDALFVVTSGAVKISLPSEEGDEAIIATVNAGEFFGELALLDGAPRAATATALEPTETLALARPRFRELISGDHSSSGYWRFTGCGGVVWKESGEHNASD